MLDVAIVPPHPTLLSLRMAVALYVTGISTPKVHPESPPLPGTLTCPLKELLENSPLQGDTIRGP